MINIDKTIENLKASPLFYLFLSSRELFHTNFWFWLSTLNKIETLKLFSEKTENKDITFKREHIQSSGEYKSIVDLYVSETIAIENKVKDFPTTEQLDRIKKSFGKTDIEFVLTTLFWTDELSFNDWTIKTYKNISDAIDPKKFTNDNYFQSLISDYKKFTLNLSEISDQLEIKQEYDFAKSFDKELYEKLNGIKLWEGYQKLRSSHLQFHFNKSNIHDITTSYGINNKKATIDFVLNLQNGYKLGIQLEDNQYRKFVTGRKAGEFAENLISSNLFLNDTFVSRERKSYLNYGVTFKYQYKKIEKISFMDLFEKVNNDFKIINNKIDDIKRNVPNI